MQQAGDPQQAPSVQQYPPTSTNAQQLTNQMMGMHIGGVQTSGPPQTLPFGKAANRSLECNLIRIMQWKSIEYTKGKV